MKELLFVYGTLKSPTIQKAVFKRTAPKDPDILKGYKKSKFKIRNFFCPVIVSDPNGYVLGLLIEVTKEELILIDKYETGAYKRKKVTLKSGKESWVYVKS